MKQNIDLTENMDFSRIINLRVKLTKNSDFPWSIKNEDQESKSNQLFYTGTKVERKESKMIYNICSGTKCDCCGKELLPWGNHKGLCEKCFDDLEKYVSGKIPWKKK